MAKKQVFSLKLPPDELALLRYHASLLGISRGELIRRIMAPFFIGHCGVQSITVEDNVTGALADHEH